MSAGGALVDRVRGLVLQAPNAPDSAPFYTAVWGLHPAGEHDGAVLFRGTGTEHHILALERAPTSGLAAIELGAPDIAAVDALHERALAMRVTVRRRPGALSTPGGGYGMELLDHEGRVLRISAGVALHPAALPDPDGPAKVSHIVLNSPDVERARAFYCELFGFIVSDWSEDQMVFLRCGSAHHDIAFNRSAHVSFNHVSFEMPRFDAVMKGIGRLRAHDTPVKWGTGCHAIGNIMFAYFIDPNGFAIEYNFYVRPFDAASHQPQTWTRSPSTMDAWGTAGPPSAEMRAAMEPAAELQAH